MVKNKRSFYQFKADLAQRTIKEFIVYRILATHSIVNLSQMDKQIKSGFKNGIPIIRVGKKVFSVHVLGLGLTAWGVRKDADAMAVLASPEFEGALFFSTKEYCGYWIISFDAYKSKEEFQKLIEEDDFNFVRIDYSLICNDDQREAFLGGLSITE